MYRLARRWVINIETALAAEAAQRPSSERAVDPRPRDRTSRPRPNRRWDFRLVALRVLAPAAAVLVLAGGGYGLSRIVASPSGSVASGSAAAPAASAARAAAPNASVAGLPSALPSVAGPSTARASHTGVLPAVEAPAKSGVVISGTDYQRATLAQQVQLELRQSARASVSLPKLAPGSVRGCVLLVTSGIRPGTLVLVETARFQGQPANVIVAVNGHRDTVWVTTPACSAGSHYVLATTTLAGTSAP